ncbi:MAG: 5'-nucleotidase C-terminal domain-containing protein [Bacteroidales bacterium]|nr:5'-nucleotidase C-terminal domain-containing protein [Bacteroidales bacterium]
MVQAKVIALAALVLLGSSCEYRYSWEKYRMDGHRTGVTAPTADNVPEALGVIEGDDYAAPNGAVFAKGGATYAVAADLIAVQPQMKEIKKVVGYATREMVAAAPESELSNWWVDRMMVDVAQLTKRKVDVGFLNFGGIRVSLPQGELQLDDFVSMFPFNNYLTYVAVKGADLQEIFNFIASSRPFVLGGAKLVVKDHKIDTLLVGGKPIDPKKTYGVATVDFLVDGGDGMTVGKNAKEMIITDKRVIDAVLPYVYSLQAAGKPVEYFTDGRCVYDQWEED